MANKITFCDEVNGPTASAFVAKLNGLPSRSSADVYISTPGGDIFAGGDMVNAVEHALERGCKLSFEMGACVASMGASLVAAARAKGCRVVARENTQMMFHGCYGVAVGGADELADQAKCMSDFNSVVIANLKKCGVEDCEDWFAADRQKWLNAKEAVALGLADEIVGSGESADEEMVTVANRFAAKWNGGRMADEVKPEEAKPEEATAPVETVDEKPAEEIKEEAEQPAAEDIEARVQDLANKRFAGLQAKHDQLINELTKTRDAALRDLEEARAESTSLKADVEKLTADLAELRDQLAKSEQNRQSIVSAALAPDAEKVNDSWAARWRAARNK